MRPTLRMAVSTALLVAAFLVLQLRSRGEAVPLRRPLGEFPTSLGEWQAEGDEVLGERTLAVLKASDTLSRQYGDRAGRPSTLFIGYWQTQRKGAIAHSPKNCLPGSGWEPVEASRVHVPLPGGSLEANRYVVEKEGTRLVVLYWYRSQGRTFASELSARAAMVRSAVIENRTDGALVRVTSPVLGSVDATNQRLYGFIAALEPVLDDYLPR